MESTNNKYEKEISFREVILKIANIFKEVIRLWHILVLFMVLGCFINLYYHFTYKNSYTSEISFMVEGKGGGGGGLSSILGSFGLNRGGKKNTFKIIEVAKSTKLLEKILLDTLENNRLLGNEILRIYSEDKQFPSFDNYTFDGNKKYLKKNSGRILKSLKSIFWNKNAPICFNEININDDSGIFKIITNTKSDTLSYNLNLMIYKNLKLFFEQEMLQNQLTAVKLLKNKADSLKSLAISKSYELARFQDENYGIFSKQDEVKKTILMADIRAINISYSEVLKNYELADYNLRDTRPLFIEIEKPYLPLSVQKSSLFKRLLLGIIIGGLLGTVIIIVRKLFLEIMKE